MKFIESLTIYSAYFELQSQVSKNNIFALFMTKVFDILMDLYQGP